jgi:hypothetical protein
MEITLQKWKIFGYIPQEETSFFTLSTTGQTTNQNIVWLQKNFENNKQQYIKKQRGSPFFYNPISIQFQQKILDLAYKLFPQIYTKKRQNFLAFRQAIDLPIQETRNIQTDTSTNTQEILQQGNRGREETNIYQWFHKFF